MGDYMNNCAKLLVISIFTMPILSCYGTYEDGAKLLPIANAGSDAVVECPALCKDYNRQHIIDGTASNDPLGEDLSYEWTIVHKPDKTNRSVALKNKEAAEPYFIVHSPGEYLFSLVVTAGDRVSAPDYVSVTVIEHDPDAQSDN